MSIVGASEPREEALDSREGWAIVGLGFLLLFLLWGAVFTFTVYADAVAGAFGLSSLETSATFSTGTAAFFLVGGTVGIAGSRLPLRSLLGAVTGSIVVAVGLFQVVDSFVGLVAAFALFSAAAGTTFVVVLSLVPLWFDAYEGTAMGLTVVGNGLGVQVMPFVWLWLLDRTTIRGAWLAVGAAAATLLVVATLQFRRPPGDPSTASAADLAWLRARLEDARFLAAWVGLALTWGWYFVFSADLVDILASEGIGRATAATAFGLIGGVSVLSRVASGALADRFGARPTLVSGIGLTAGGLLLLSVVTTVPTMYAAMVTFGVGLGAVAALFAPIVIGAFGPGNATAITGVFTFCSAAAGFLAPLGVGVLAAAVGGYGLPLVVLAGLTLAGAGLFYWGTAPTSA